MEFEVMVADPGLMREIVKYVAGGGTLIDLAQSEGVVYKDLLEWVEADATRRDRYEKAVAEREQWGKEKILAELRKISVARMVDLMNPDGSIKPIADWPDSARASVESVEYWNPEDGGGIKKIKLTPKLAAIELLGKATEGGLWKDRVEHGGSVGFTILTRVPQPDYIDATAEKVITIPAQPVEPVEPASGD